MSNLTETDEVINNSNEENMGTSVENKKTRSVIVEAKKLTPKSEKLKIKIVDKDGSREESRCFGFLKQNRPIANSNVVNFLQIINNGEYDDVYPIVTAEATALLEDGYEIVDLEGNPINELVASEYLIVLDGQHRIIAFSKLNAVKPAADKITIPNVRIKAVNENVGKYLASINLAGHSWTTADKICVSSIITDNKLLIKANELIKEGFNASTAILICTGKRLTASQIKKMLSKNDTSTLPKGNDLDEALNRAEKFYTICMSKTGITTKILTKRFFINGFNSYAASTSDDTAFEGLNRLYLSDFECVREDVHFISALRKASEALAPAA
ncbi:hypothetical protein [Dysgonomonas sp. HGC4]|uniref:hypothetical protein n=1 Tax=Dysgonomonas sp. HGC4 TaxID=1658009 RepID=UPI0006816F3B|nr:hypothetical protein [Dysgonomonas sp. HGC4]MBD8348796.1 hypothetical protein [Dysgonomonas sp. HGC4]